MGRDSSQIAKLPLDKLLLELLNRVVKSLDVCNVVALSLDVVKNLQHLIEIVVAALNVTSLDNVQVRRAKKAFSALISAKLTENNANAKGTEHNRSFGRRTGNNPSDHHNHRKVCVRRQKLRPQVSWCGGSLRLHPEVRGVFNSLEVILVASELIFLVAAESSRR
ncbi:hypothetical protein VNO80_27563 [Phaseolus coccineus]|uniref:Uncharacterized protein n=1 Tax=Phaseolus coccineus TaxID=3886 RepID=A0AAN9LGK1_PHACN